MAELVVMVVDRLHPHDVYLNAAAYKRGDVIEVRPDGWPWGTEELAHPDWRILRIPDLTVSEASALLAEERNTDPAHQSRTLQRRAFKLDLEHAAVGELRAFFDDHAVVPIEPRESKSLKQIAQTAGISSHIEEMVQPMIGDLPPVFRTTVRHRVVVKYPVVQLHPTTKARLAGLGVTHTGPNIRKHCAAVVDASLIATLKTMKPPIADPAVIG